MRVVLDTNILIRANPQSSGKLADLVFGVIRSILDPNHLTDAGPLVPALERDEKVHASKERSCAELRFASFPSPLGCAESAVKGLR